MPFRDQYQAQVRLLMRLIPIVARETCFALKGGTAINLFVRDLPRLSVDIDLMYLPMHERSEALVEIDAAMKRIKTSALADLRGARVTENVHDGAVLRLLVMAEGTQVKIEVSPVLRGVVHEPFIAPSPKPLKRCSALRKPMSFHSKTFLRASLLPRWTANIRATFSMCGVCLPMRA